MSKIPGLHMKKDDKGLLHMHREIPVDVDAVINIFALQKNRKMAFVI